MTSFIFFSIRCRSYLTKSAVEKGKGMKFFYKIIVDKNIILCYNIFVDKEKRNETLNKN